MQIPPNLFTSFSPNFFLTILLVKSKFLTVQNSKTAVFSRVFTQNNSTIFLGEVKLNFWTKNEDFEQCVIILIVQFILIFFLSFFASFQEVKIFNCPEPFCSHTTSVKANLNKHIRQVHADHRPHACQFCGKMFKRRAHLDRHTTSQHPTGVHQSFMYDWTVFREIYLENGMEMKIDDHHVIFYKYCIASILLVQGDQESFE